MKFMPPDSPDSFNKAAGPNDEFEKQLSALSLIEPSEEYHKLAASIVDGRNNLPVSNRKSWLGAAAAFGFTCVAVAGLMYTVWEEEKLAERSLVIDTPFNSATSTIVVSNEESPLYVAGTHYQEFESSDPVGVQQLADISIFFSYPCFPCFKFEEVIDDWARSTSSQPAIAYVPAIWSEETRYYAQVFYATERLGIRQDSHKLLYQALHEDELMLQELPVLSRFFTSLGISQQQFLTAFNSEATLNQVRVAEQANRSYRIQSVPSLLVDCEYHIALNSEVTQANMLPIAEYLLTNLDQGNSRSC